ncbi:MAG: transcription antitermination factor NusB [Nannocystaceae bacterium]
MAESEQQQRRGRKDRGAGRSERGDGRELALLALCHLESYDADERASALAIFWDHPPGVGAADEGAAPIAAWVAEGPIRAFAERLVRAVIDGGPAIDETIESTSRSWRVARMDRVDRNILRMVTAELGSVPGPRAG